MAIILTIVAVLAVLLALFIALVAYIGWRYERVQGTSRAVAEWAHDPEPTRRVGALNARLHGNLAAPTAIIALHGLASSGAYYGRNWSALADENTSLVVPDLLGFGDSVDRGRTADEHSIEHHVAALHETLDAAVPDAKHLHIVAHSFGSIVALAYAREVIDRVASVTLISPPLHDSREEAEQYIVARGRVTRYFAVDRLSARIMRAFICSRPFFARTVTRFAAPAMPSELARRTHLHSWASYIGTFRAFLDNRGWRSTMSLLSERGIPVRVLVGSRDQTIDRSVIDALTGDPVTSAVAATTAGASSQTSPIAARIAVHPSVTVLPDHGHQLPLTNPTGCVDFVRATIERMRANAITSMDTASEQVAAIGSQLEGTSPAPIG